MDFNFDLNFFEMRCGFMIDVSERDRSRFVLISHFLVEVVVVPALSHSLSYMVVHG